MVGESKSVSNEHLELWVDDYDDFPFGNVEQEEQEVNLLPHLQSKNFESLQKTLFFRIGGLFIAQLEGKIREDEFKTAVKDYLLDHTQNYELIDQLTNQTYYILQEIKTIPINDNYYGNESIKDMTKQGENERKKIVFIEPIEMSRFPNLLQLSDFGLINRIELGLYAVTLEMGFNQFNRLIRGQVEIIRQETHANVMPVYKKVIDLVINNTIYMTNRIYGIMYNKFYNRVLKQFVDKV